MQRIIELDSQLLTNVQSCLRKTKYQFIDNIVPMSNAPALERGGLMHDLIEMYYGIKGNLKGMCINPDSRTWISLVEANFCSPDFSSLEPLRKDKDSLVKWIKIAGEFRATKLELGMETCIETIDQFEQYANYYKVDSWSPLYVEEVASKVIYETEELKIIYTGKMDRVMENGNTTAPFDTKTSARNMPISSMSNQFIGYCYLLGVNTLIVDRIGFQKTLKPAERFKREQLYISTDRQEEWVDNTIHSVYQYMDALDNNNWPMKIGNSCDAYSGCAYRNLCESSPTTRGDKMKREYRPNPRWNPSEHLEEKKV